MDIFHRKIDFSTIFRSESLTTRVQEHLFRVYSLLAVCLVSTFFGLVFDRFFHVGGFLSQIAAALLMGWLRMERGDLKKRIGIMVSFAFLSGVSMGSLIEYAMWVNPQIVLSAVVITMCVFVGFSVMAMISSRRSMLYLGGLLASCGFYLAIGSFMNIFVRSSMFYSAQLYIGLALFCGYVMFDTQLIVEKVSHGDGDFVWHAVELFVDFVAILVRVLIILLKNSQNDQRRKQTRRTNEDDEF